MTFLIKQKNSYKDKFDLTAFNYLFNKKTAFSETSSFTISTYDSERLDDILSKMKDLSPVYL